MNRSIYEDYEVENEYVLKLYEVLKNCRGQDFDRIRLMQTVKECRKAMHGFRGWYRHAQTLQSRESELTQKAKQHAQTLQSRESELTQKAKRHDSLEKELSRLQSDLDTEQKKIKEMNTDMEKLVLDNSRFLMEQKDLFDDAENLHKRLASLNQKTHKKNRAEEQAKSLKRQVRKLRQEMVALKYSSSFRMGQIIINAIKKPGKNTLLMPYYLVKLGGYTVSGRARDELRKTL